MARTRKNPPLRILLNGREVGLLSRASSGAIDFQYARDWLDWENAIPVSLSLPLREDRYIGPRVLAVFENLLPVGLIVIRETGAVLTPPLGHQAA